MSKTSSSRYISVFIPTFNGEKYLRECIDQILIQKLPGNYSLELLITDSGSSDGTVEIIKSYGDTVLFRQITNSEFGHGKTRQQAAESASGEFILFLTQDATPATDRWVMNMIEPFFLSDKVGCVFGRQIPRPFSVPTIKREVATVFGGLGAPDSIIIHRNKSLIDNTETNQLNSFFSDVNSAVRRDLLVGRIPFRDLAYSEDQALAEDIQKHGYLKAYSPSGAVWHSNEYTAKEYYHRKFDEYIGLQESIGFNERPSIRSVLLGWITPSVHDFKFLRHDQEYNLRAKLKFAFLVPMYNFALKLGKYKALKHVGNQAVRKRLSLENKSKNV